MSGRDLGIRLDLSVRLRRHRRSRCGSCGRVRVLYSLAAVPGGAFGESESARLCAECSGIRSDKQPDAGTR